MKSSKVVAILVLSILLSGCGDTRDQSVAPAATTEDLSDAPATLAAEQNAAGGGDQGATILDADFVRLDPPAGPNVMAPSLWQARRGVLLVWLEPEGDGYKLMFSRLEDETWRNPVEIARGDRFFANWADTPSVVEAANGVLYSHWLEKLGPGTYSYGIRLAMSEDGGESWTPMGWLHDDLTETEHGFVSMVPEGGGVRAVWLDGRALAGGGAMQLRSASIAGRQISDRTVVSNSVCECCSTSLVAVDDGAVVAFRGRSPREIRDIAIARRAAGAWQEPRLVHEDGWEIPGCPVNGPAVAADDTGLAVAWFTAAHNRAMIKVAFGSGQSLMAPIVLDDDEPVGRVGIARAEGEAYVTWVASSTRGLGAEIRIQRVGEEGRRGEPRIVALTSASRTAGVPRIVRDGARMMVVWVEAKPGEDTVLRAATIPVGDPS